MEIRVIVTSYEHCVYSYTMECRLDTHSVYSYTVDWTHTVYTAIQLTADWTYKEDTKHVKGTWIAASF